MITLQKFRNDFKHSKFSEVYSDLMLGNKSENLDRKTVYKLALLLLNYGDESVSRLGYRIILRYSNTYRDYQPLYDVSIASNYIPIAKFIEERKLINFYNSQEFDEESFNTLFLSAYKDTYKYNGFYMTKGQRDMISFTQKEESDFVVVAPTSYGKSDMMVNLLDKYQGEKICFIVPTKALLAQTKRNILSKLSNLSAYGKIITHPDMYNNDEKFIAVLTQERLLRLLQKNPSLDLDIVLVDEAHSLLEDNPRSYLLAFVLIILKKRNSSMGLKFFTPFLVESSSIQIPYLDNKLISKKSNERLKIERFFYVEKVTSQTNVHLYDQFLNEFNLHKTLELTSDTAVVEKLSGNKNIVYLNRPSDIEKVAKSLKGIDLKQQFSNIVNEICDNIADFLHKDYNLIKYIKKGVLYHHGSMPDLIRLYVEHIFREHSFLKYIVTSSTLLEGVNIPADKLFMLDYKKGTSKLTPPQFKNLIGRVGRFKEIFDKENGNIDLLEPCIYIIKSDFVASNSNIKKFIQNCANESKSISDNISNLLLKSDDEIINLPSTEQIKYIDKIQQLENIEPNTISHKEIKYANSEIGKACFVNNINEFNIIENEGILVNNFMQFNKEKLINSPDQLMNAIYEIFLKDEKLESRNNNLLRLRQEEARNFYSMFLSWRVSGSSYKRIINEFVRYWKGLKDERAKVYFGARWGEIKRDPTDFYEAYIDVSRKNNEQLVNLAIIKIKEEQDFVDNQIMKFVEILNDIDLLDKDFYDMIKYGSNDPEMICLLKNGYSIELTRYLLSNSFRKYVHINVREDKVIINPVLLEEMRRASINNIIIFEMDYHVNSG